jgi:hypothetical protein
VDKTSFFHPESSFPKYNFFTYFFTKNSGIVLAFSRPELRIRTVRETGPGEAKKKNVKEQLIKHRIMKTPIHPELQNNNTHAENLRQQYQELVEKSGNGNTEIKKNLLLTPFLLSIPVIFILFILIWGSTSDIPATIRTEPPARDVVITDTRQQPNAIAAHADTLISINNTLALPAKK